MSGSILDGCGKYSEELTEISNLIKKTKLKNGEPFDQKINLNVEQDVYYAYQRILSTLVDRPELIGVAINNFKQKVQESPNVSSVFGISESSTQVAMETSTISNEISQDDVINSITETIVDTMIINEVVYEKEDIVESMEKMAEATELNNFDEFDMTFPPKEGMEFENETDEMIEKEICMINTAIRDLYYRASYYPPEKIDGLREKIEEIKSKSSHDLWIDAELRYFNFSVGSHAQDGISSDWIEYEELGNLLDTLKPGNVEKTEFVDDQFTSWEKIGLARGLIEACRKNPTEEAKKLCMKMQEVDPEIYELVSKNLEKFKEIEGKSSDDFIFADGVSDRKSFLDNMRKQLGLELEVEKPEEIKEENESEEKEQEI